MKIIVRNAAGLANRMFQYALYKSLEAKGNNVFLDDSYVAKKWDFENVSITHIFPNVTFKRPTKFQILSLFGGYDKISTIIRHLPFVKNKICFFYKREFSNSVFNHKRSAYIIGTFSSEQYFYDIQNQIRHDFKFKPFTDKRNIDIEKKMKAENSVAIHIRKGADYNKSITNGTCGISFYNDAIDYIKQQIDNPLFYIFTDNVQWVKENFDGLDYTLIDWNPVSGDGNHLDMQLMSCARHNIIANSTYSWWGAWLNNNPNKIVIAPLKWYNEGKNSRELGFVPSTWLTF
jgi:hypothetical protein